MQSNTVMKTKAVFHSLLAATLATTFLAGEIASAQMKTTASPDAARARSSLRTKVKKATAKQEEKSPWGLEIANIGILSDKSESNLVEIDVTGEYEFLENVSFSLYQGFESYFAQPEKNNAFDLEPSVSVSNIELVQDLKLKLTLGLVLPTSRDAHETGRTGGYRFDGDFSTKISDISIGFNNSFYQFTYQSPPGATPELSDLDEDNTYKNVYSQFANVVSVGVPLGGPFKWSVDMRNRIKTYFSDRELHQFRLRTRLGVALSDAVTAQVGISGQKDVSKSGSLFQPSSRAYYVNLILSI